MQLDTLNYNALHYIISAKSVPFPLVENTYYDHPNDTSWNYGNSQSINDLGTANTCMAQFVLLFKRCFDCQIFWEEGA